MKKYFPPAFLWLLLSAGAALFFSYSPNNKKAAGPEEKENPLAPSEHFFLVRSYPDKIFDHKGYEQAMTLAKQSAATQRTGDDSRSSSSWITEGPANIGGRVNVVAVHPLNPNIVFAGCAAGGIFKTTNGGISWVPVFDNQLYLSIGCIVFDPVNPNIMYAGTGDPNISGYPFIGDGIYKSTNGGNTWTHLGLAAQRIVSKIIVDPTNSNIIYAATMGLPFIHDTNRGLYKTTDGGTTWNNILFISDSAGVIDLLMNPSNPQVLYAAGWNRIRTNQVSLVFGPAAKIYKTTNGGSTWNTLSGGLPMGDMSRITLAMSGSNPNVVFASYVDTSLELEGIYKSTNAGTNWNPIPIGGLPPSVMGGFGWYFGKLGVNPADDNEIYVLGIDLHVTYNSGGSWQDAAPPWWTYEVHADKHDMVFINSTDFLLATDGGVYKTTDAGFTWNDFENLPNTQFYRVSINPHLPGTYAGGAQDNGTTQGDFTTINNWPRIFGGDGFQPLFDANDPSVMWCETQDGEIYSSLDGGFNFNSATAGLNPSDRRSWDMPIIMSSANPNVLYTGTYRVYQNTSGPFPSWVPLSPDLTDGVIFEDRFHVISAVAESPVNTNFLYAGTSDANVWRSLDGGNNWSNVTSTLPDRYVTSVKASTVSAATVYVTHSGYKYNDFIPHIHKSTNNGSTWTSVSGDLPPAAVNDILPFPGNDNILFAATDAGVYYTLNAGVNWSRAGNNMPIIPVYDIEYDAVNQRLVAGTHARSIMSISVDTILSSAGIVIPEQQFLFSVRYLHATNSLNLKIHGAAAGNYTLKLFSISGALVSEFPLHVTGTLFEQELSIPDFRNGIYLAVLTGKQHGAAERFILAR